MIQHNVEQVIVDVIKAAFTAAAVTIQVRRSIEDNSTVIALPSAFVHAEMSTRETGRTLIYGFDVTVKVQELIPEQSTGQAVSIMAIVESALQTPIHPASLSAFSLFAMNGFHTAKVAVMGDRRDSDLVLKLKAIGS